MSTGQMHTNLVHIGWFHTHTHAQTFTFRTQPLFMGYTKLSHSPPLFFWVNINPYLSTADALLIVFQSHIFGASHGHQVPTWHHRHIPISWCLAIVHLSSFYDHISFSCILALIGIHVISSLVLLWIRLLWELLCKVSPLDFNSILSYYYI